MRVEYINPFSEAAYGVLKEVLAVDVKRGDLYLKPTNMTIMGVAAMVGLAGEVEGRVLFDMTKDTALFVANTMSKVAGIMADGEEFKEMNADAKAVITELANMITAQAVTKLHDLGFKFDLTPPALFTGDNMEVSSNMGSTVEALIVPMDLGGKGKIEVNVVIRERT
ncbi:MAG: chemotaxis protein CheX [Spirochaetaceae bacterium]|jgi:chemotaxis protein CheX|nr:chemotaxis protein CheX [Spirochaetaceae bacterium]